MIALSWKKSPMAALLLPVVLAACSSASGAKGSIHEMGSATKAYAAHSLIFNRNAPPSITEKSFRCQMESIHRADLRSYRFSNYLSGAEKPDVVVTLAISGRSAGLGIYNTAGAPLAEYTNGKAMENMAEFELRGKEGSTRIKWYLGEGNIMSVFESYDAGGILAASENTVYLAK